MCRLLVLLSNHHNVVIHVILRQSNILNDQIFGLKGTIGG